jgi:hypothetical protein
MNNDLTGKIVKREVPEGARKEIVCRKGTGKKIG